MVVFTRVVVVVVDVFFSARNALFFFAMFYYLLDSVCFHLCIQCLVFCGSNGLQQINRYIGQYQIMRSGQLNVQTETSKRDRLIIE